jgi:hypothetical protein
MRAQLTSFCFAAALVAAFIGCSPVTRDLGDQGSGGHAPTSSSTGGKGTGASGSGASGSGASGSSASGTGGMGTGGTGGSATTPPYVDGSRLRAVVIAAGNGAFGFEHWRDTQLKVPCQFVPTSDGKYHCAPIQNNTLAYSDSGCTMKVAVLAPCGTPGAYLVDQQNGSCQQSISNVSHGTPATIYSIGAKLGSGVVYTMQGQPATCTAGASSDYYTITIADLSPLVAATLSQEARGSRLEAEVLDGDDGSKQLTGQVYDQKMGDEACTLDASGDPNDPSFFCVPGAVAQVDPNQAVYDDPTCMTPVAEEYGSNGVMCPPAKVVVSEPTNQTSCNLGMATFYDTGTDVTAGNICSLNAASGACTCQTDTTGDRYYTIGAKLDPSTFAALALSKIGAGRLQALALATPTGEPLSTGVPTEFWDTKSGGASGESCSVKHFMDGTLRCVPETALVTFSNDTILYQDSACSEQVVSQYVDPSCPAPAPSSIVTVKSAANVCTQDTVTAQNAVGMAVPVGTQIYYNSGGCTPYATVTSMEAYYAIGAALDANTTYPPLTEMTD